MLLIMAALTVGLVGPVTAGSPPVTTTFASAARTCDVLQAAYTATTNSRSTAYPPDVQTASRILSVLSWTPDFKASLSLSSQEFEDMAGNATAYAVPNFKPACEWKGTRGAATDEKGHATYVTFTAPIFAKTGRLALVEVSFREQGSFGYGLICVVRRPQSTWSATCVRNWIT